MPVSLPAWHVDAQNVHQETTLAPNATGLVQRWVIPYVIDDGPAKGTTHTVYVAPADFTAAGVEQAIRVDLNNVHQVASLRSSGAVLG